MREISRLALEAAFPVRADELVTETVSAAAAAALRPLVDKLRRDPCRCDAGEYGVIDTSQILLRLA